MSKQDWRELQAYRSIGKPEELVKVVRCKDCRKASFINGEFCGCARGSTSENGFCYRGERKQP